MNRSGIKREAKSFISENNRWLNMALTYLPLWVICGGMTTFVGIKRTVQGIPNVIDGDVLQQHSAGVQGTFGSFSWLISILVIPFSVAMTAYFLEFLRQKNLDFSYPYKEGANRYTKYLQVDFTTSLITWLWALLFIIPGIIKSYTYSQTRYIIHDNPNLSAKQARDISERMTDGYKSELFVLDLSFCLWGVLVLLTCGLARFYVYPYQSTTRAMYYENLKAIAISEGRVSPQELGMVVEPTYNQDYNAAPTTYENPVAPENAPESADVTPNTEDTDNNTDTQNSEG